MGAGFTGLATAWRLAAHGLDVAVIEAAAVGEGASGRTGGIVLEDTAAGPLEGLSGCIAALERLIESAGLDCELELGGCWELSHHPPTPEAEPLWRDGDASIFVAAEVPGGTLDPGALLSGLARACAATGVAVLQHCRVERLELGDPPRLRVAGQTGAEPIVCDHVVLGLNAYTRRLIPPPQPLRCALTLALLTEPLASATLDAIGLSDRRPFYTTDLPYLWGRSLRDGQVIFGGGLAFDPEDALERISVFEGEADAALRRLESRIRGFHPALSDVLLTARWGGPVAFTPDRLPLLGHHPECERVILTGGYAGHGVALSARVAERVADAIARGRRALPSAIPSL